MAKAEKTVVGDVYEITEGLLAGEIVTIVDPEPFPDTDIVRRRKITVRFDGDDVYVLPRQLRFVERREAAVIRALEAEVAHLRALLNQAELAA